MKFAYNIETDEITLTARTIEQQSVLDLIAERYETSGFGRDESGLVRHLSLKLIPLEKETSDGECV